MNPESNNMIAKPGQAQSRQMTGHGLPERLPLRVLCLCAMLAALAGCADQSLVRSPLDAAVRAEIAAARPVQTLQAPVAVPAGISAALAEPAPPAALPPPEPRLDLLVNNAQAREVFLAIVADTRYSMLMHPDVSGTLSVTLRGVTVPQALEAIRDVYGYDFKIDGRRITIFAPSLQTRIFTVNYPNSQRAGSSELRVSSGAAAMQQQGGSATASNATGNPAPVGNTGNNSSGNSGNSSAMSMQQESSRVSTTLRTDLWAELSASVKSMLGNAPGRSVIASPQAGIIVVRAMPDELRQVEQFLSAARFAVERQVMLEAKIVQVELRDGFQSGIDWSALRNTSKSTGALGVLGGNNTSNTLVSGVRPNLPGFPTGIAPLLADGVSIPNAGSGLFGLAFATDGFQAVLGFLETRGDVQILSSPRIATLNNQKAVLKVGTDDFYITGITGGTINNNGNSANSSNTTLPTLTLAQFFSGIALDVTPQVDETDNITLHVHPSVTTVTEKTKQVDLGGIGSFKLPLASSAVNESDTLVRIQDGNIVAIGGLMQLESARSASGLPGSTEIPVLNSILGNRASTGRKKELVVLIRPSIIRNAQDWEAQTRRARLALDELDPARARVIRLDGAAEAAKPKTP